MPWWPISPAEPITKAGFETTDWLGDFDGGPYSESSPEIIPVARVQAKPA
jgi:hypothetical protein